MDVQRTLVSTAVLCKLFGRNILPLSCRIYARSKVAQQSRIEASRK